jgi:phosphoribosylglycinamide formyltransferase 1
MHETINLGIMISGSGTTMEAVIKATKEGGMLHNKVKPVVVIASKSGIAGCEKADKLGIPVRIVERKLFNKSKTGLNEFGWAILAYLKEFDAHYVSQNGWLPLTPSNVIESFKGGIFNQHPGPLDPDNIDINGIPIHFGGKGMHGLAVHSAVLEFQRQTKRIFPSEATIHRVCSEVDGGAVVARQFVEIISGDTPELLSARMLPIEHQLQIDFWQNVYKENVTELYRNKPLIHDGEEQFLHQAIIYARDAYPNG